MLKQKQKPSILTIDFDLTRGLILNWNLKGNLNLNVCYYRHVIILDDNSIPNCKKFVSQYFQKIKSGDIISISYIDQDHRVINIKEKQKSLITVLEIDRLKPMLSSFEDLLDLVQLLMQKTKQYDQPIFLSFYTSRKKKQIQTIEKHMKNYIQKKQDLFVNIFANVDNQVDVTSGINYFNRKQASYDPFWNFIKNFYSQIALLKAKVTIQFENGAIYSQKQNQWKNISFNKIVREIKCPSVNYQQDVISFVRQQSCEQIKYILYIKLEYKDLQNKRYVSEKKISINTMSEKIYQRTFGKRQSQFSVEIFPQIYSNKNPYKSQSMVWFKSQIPQQDV